MNRHGFRRPLPRNIYRREHGPEAFRRSAAAAVCPVKALCGSCKYVNQDYRSSLDEKFHSGLAALNAAGVLQVARVLDPVESPRQLEYRSLFKLAIRPSSKAERERPAEHPSRFAIGLFAAGSHALVPMEECPLHTAPLKRLVRDLRLELDASTLTPFDESSHSGQVRYVAARAAHLTGELMVTFVVTEPVKDDLKRVVEALKRRGHKINSAHMNLNTDAGNAIFGEETLRLAGTDRLRESLCDLKFEVGPTAFFQVNPWQALNLYRRVEQVAGPASADAVAWDLYCGTGQISLILARLGYRVFGAEENSHAVDDAVTNAAKNHLTDRTTFLPTRVEDMEPKLPRWATSPALIVANPSRRGLAEGTRQHLVEVLKANPEARFVYVSCDVTTLARDLKELMSSGFCVRQVEPFDMFPQTDHMEWLTVLSRA